jgi:hypothetical protein
VVVDAQRVANSLTRARKLFEKGKYELAGKTLAQERKASERLNDPEALSIVDEWIAQCSGQLEGDDLDELRLGLGIAEQYVEVNPAGIVVGALGALAMLVAVFLPYADASSSGFVRIEKNTLIQNGAGWAFVILAVIGGIRIYAAHQAAIKTWAPIVSGLLACGYAIYFGKNGGDSLKLCSVATGTNCQVANPGTGVYLAGIGGLLMAVGGLLIRSSSTVIAEAEMPSAYMYRECPHCKEDMRRDASVCPHCRHGSDGWHLVDGDWRRKWEGEWWVLDEKSGEWEPLESEA